MSVEAVSNDLTKFKKAEVSKPDGQHSSNVNNMPGKKTDAPQENLKEDLAGGDQQSGRLDNAISDLAQAHKYSQVMTEKAIENANNRIRATRTNARFEYNEDINRITITITDADDEVIKEIPPEATQKILERIHTFSGMLMDEEI